MAVFGRELFTSLALLAALSSVSAVQKLNSIKQLKKLDFGSSVPKHSLLLLHWFANVIDISNNDVIYLTFDLGEYGSHHYGNFEGILNTLPQGNARYRYVTVGNLANQNEISDFPSYVINPPPEFRAFGNQDRIVFRVRESNNRRQNQQIIDEVYLTQHFGRQHASTSYDENYTYQITTNLLREIREFSVEDQTSTLSELRDDFQDDISDYELKSIKMKWGKLAILGLFLYIVIEKKYSVRKNNQPQKKKKKDFVVNIPDSGSYYHDHPGHSSRNYNNRMPASWQQHLVQDSIELKVTTGGNGKARIKWRNVPRHRLQEDVMVVLYKEGETESCFKKSIGTKDGSCDTSVALNEGLHARLHKARTVLCFWKSPDEEISRGPAFTSPGSVHISGYDASLQLFVKDGKACARIYIQPSLREWRSLFNKAWVGFYTSADKATNEYEFWKWQWVTNFTQTDCENVVTILEYHSSMTIATGVQARFIMDGLAKACSPCWQ
ncbi:uncharacterized protein LOC128750803 [Synchiropus splendidus]|uniref:uncharacterized protein LOC128750803 n=1 Tax=Synchiropus splendidus TaxID=270530 RepID=UPI00237DA9D1|nr:uncharacterized protein LOC128750803 [Synchiropus splendidus]XP_053707297.1 uncharacterized protein LOC128750803 [Synchiropus splendidus]